MKRIILASVLLAMTSTLYADDQVARTVARRQAKKARAAVAASMQRSSQLVAAQRYEVARTAQLTEQLAVSAVEAEYAKARAAQAQAAAIQAHAFAIQQHAAAVAASAPNPGCPNCGQRGHLACGTVRYYDPYGLRAAGLAP